MVKVKYTDNARWEREDIRKEKILKAMYTILVELIKKEKGNLEIKRKWWNGNLYVREKRFCADQKIEIILDGKYVKITVYNLNFFDLANKAGNKIEKELKHEVTIYKDYTGGKNG